MTDDELLNRLLQTIERDMAPVRPLRPPWIRAAVPVAVCLALGALVVSVAGVRPDVEVVGSWRLLGYTVVQIAFCAGLFGLGLRWSIPAMEGMPATVFGGALGAVGAHALITGAILERSAQAPPFGSALRISLACLAAITVMSLAPMAAGAVLILRGLATRWLPAFATIGFASGLAADAVWRMHCQYSTWSHVLPFHWGPIGVAVVVALTAAVYARRNAGLPLPRRWR